MKSVVHVLMGIDHMARMNICSKGLFIQVHNPNDHAPVYLGLGSKWFQEFNFSGSEGSYSIQFDLLTFDSILNLANHQDIVIFYALSHYGFSSFLLFFHHTGSFFFLFFDFSMSFGVPRLNQWKLLGFFAKFLRFHCMIM